MVVSLMSYLCFVLVICTNVIFTLSFSSAQSNGCSAETGKFSTNNTYSQNLDLILSTLPSNGSQNGGFYNTTIAQDLDKVYALAFCRGDIASGVCVEYENHKFFSVMEVIPSFTVPNPNDISPSSQDQFNETFPMLVEILMKNASSGSKFATGNMNFTDSEKVYGLVQCTSDISETDCRICLQGAMVELLECCGKKQGGRVLRPSCIA
ncbi:hypothetical protein Gotri_004355 [Gossypium trilobum]|uniref:Gnk2-homologous domain-containing protein n=1 Tax=Gossypium trilobum TaxID=34281 RepID=A0A7J9F6K6_9ROSI|nr:hypothetical protein [Gossypium trilobum]